MNEPLDVVQRWMLDVLRDPGGVEAAEPGAIEARIRPSSRLPAAERLAVYAHAYHARLIESLGASFPILRRALGGDLFDGFAIDYLRDHPSRSYTLHRLGDHLADWLAATRPDLDADGRPPAAPSWPDFLIDLARLEAAIDDVFDGPGTEGLPLLTSDDLARIDPADWPDHRLVTAPCLRLLSFRFPVSDYYTAARRAAEDEPVAIPEPDPSLLLLTRRDHVVRRFPLSRPQLVLLEALVAGRTVGQAIAALADQTDLADQELADSLGRWFADWTAAGHFVAIDDRPASST